MPMVGSNKYSQEIADKILDLVSAGKSLTAACRGKGMPVPSTVYRWAEENPNFGARFEMAKEERAHMLSDEILVIADAPATTSEEVQRNRLRVDARKWLASKLLPRVYADRIEANGVFALVDLAGALEAARRRVIDG
jgi:hypothetical protein